jgi:hypothetical protein
MKQWEHATLFTTNLSKFFLSIKDKNYYPIISSITKLSDSSLECEFYLFSPDGILLNRIDDYMLFGKEWKHLHPLNNWHPSDHTKCIMNYPPSTEE